MPVPRHADDLLRIYVEAIHQYGSAPSAGYTVHTGSLAQLFCSTPKCGGFPRLEKEEDGRIPVWKCSRCRKPWKFERVELSRGEIGGRVAGGLRSPSTRGKTLRNPQRLRSQPRRSAARGGLASTRAAEALGDIAQVLDQVAAHDVHAFAAWRIHLFDDTEIRALRSKSLGISMDQLPRRIRSLVHLEYLPPYEQAITLYRVRRWISGARRHAWDLYTDRRLGVRGWKGRASC